MKNCFETVSTTAALVVTLLSTPTLVAFGPPPHPFNLFF